MALPVAPPPKSTDVAATARAGITVRVAWTLLRLGVKVRPEVLHDARGHALYHIDPATPPTHAEDLAAHHTTLFVARARGREPEDPWPQDWTMPLSPRWRRALERSMTPLARTVFRKHYGDNRSLARLEASCDEDALALDAARGGLREVVKGVATSDGLPVDDWAPERVDGLLQRLAAWSPGPCPPLLDVLEGCHREHVDGCARCDRMNRLVRASILTVDDLLAPTLGARPNQTAKVLALQIHPDARRFRKGVLDELDVAAWPISDVLLLDGDQLHKIEPVLRMAAEVRRPAAEFIRGALVEGPGSWTERGLLGPMCERATREVRHRSWGRVDGVGELPKPAPAAPSARRWWSGVLAIAAIGLFVLRGVLAPPPSDMAASPLQAEFTSGRQGVWAAFDVPEGAVVLVVAERDGALEPVLWSSTAADKAALAVGDGTYRVHVPGSGALLAVVDRPPEQPHHLLHPDMGRHEPDALAALSRRLAASDVGAHVEWFRP